MHKDKPRKNFVLHHYLKKCASECLGNEAFVENFNA